MEKLPQFNDIYDRLQKQWQKTSFWGQNGYNLFTSIAFGLCLLLVLKFFGFDRTPRCSDGVCCFKMLVMIFSVAFATAHIFALLFGKKVAQKLAPSFGGDETTVAFVFTGIGFFLTFILSFVMTIYAAGAFYYRWMGAAFYCLLWVFQPIFTLLAIYMWKKELEQVGQQEIEVKPNQVRELGSQTTVFSAEPKMDCNSDYTSLMMISPRLSGALIQQWIDRLCEVETQNDPIEMRRTVREVLQHMNSMINGY